MAKSPAATAGVGILGGGSRKGSSSSSPEFEFWKFRNFSFSDSRFPAADELIVDGVLLPFSRAAPAKTVRATEPEKEAAEAEVESEEAAETPSKRWRDIFKLLGGDEKRPAKKPPTTPQVKERRSMGTGGADLNINIWPFSRSRSAGCAGAPRPKLVSGAGFVPARRSTSAPCSRSNSGGESKSSAAGVRRATPPSPARGVHVGRNSPVWQVRRRLARAKETTGSTEGGHHVRVINLSVPLCMGYGREVDGNGDGGGCRPAGGGAGGGLFGLKALFSKKVY